MFWQWIKICNDWRGLILEGVLHMLDKCLLVIWEELGLLPGFLMVRKKILEVITPRRAGQVALLFSGSVGQQLPKVMHLGAFVRCCLP